MTMVLVLAISSLVAWLYLLIAHHRFWRADQRLEAAKALDHWPHITAIIPARNEAESIARCLTGLLEQTYQGQFDLVLVDDNSSDDTKAIAQQTAMEHGAEDRLTIVSAPPLAAGWTGKLWALSHGVAAAGKKADFLWLTDADALHGPDVLAQLVSKTQTDGVDLASLMIRLRTKSLWERWIVPAFIFFFQMLYPFPAINDPRKKHAGAAGGCILVRRDRLEAAGGIAAIRTALIDDCSLARKIQDAGGRLWLGLAKDSYSLRGSDGLMPLWVMVKRTAFTQLHYSTLLLLATLLGLSLVFLVPPALTVVAIVTGQWSLAGIAGLAWLLMTIAYAPTLRDYGQSPIKGLFLPIIAALYTAMTLHSAIDHWRGKGSHWKGRDYSADGETTRTGT
ncbi:hypothetical protein JCM17844_07700 [Iodidimonas gelatinilytica]|uniref:Glycosyltransferase 2-like domain-containing protein n=1 Tax=Iodidimonas gelatinilytica TaxID=1236966 RepID=A0A5A7MPL0_9PROT|nr:glycosyltransferase [Iodidimonas gelatinilytica]GEQ97133.1 hypothetical protein JCM17844_07700 [Iodidimonas gelatinilytica]